MMIVACFAECLSNERPPPWSSCCPLMSVRLISLNKNLGFCLWAWGGLGGGWLPSASEKSMVQRQRKHVALTNCVGRWRLVFRVAPMKFTLCGNNTSRRRTGDSLSLTREMHSMRRIGQPCCGPSNMSGRVAHGLLLSDTATGPLLWCMTWKGRANYCIERMV